MTPPFPADSGRSEQHAGADAELTARAVLLDMDGTLVDSKAAVERAWRAWAGENGLDPEEVLKVVHGRQGPDSMAILLPGRPRELNVEESARVLASETADTEGVVPVPGASALLSALRTLPHALVTSADDALMRARMGAAGLPIPPVVVTAEQVSAGKPDPEGYLKAAAELGFGPADCVVFEDSEAGIAAGVAAGMRVVGVGEGAEAAPDAGVRTLEQVTAAPAPGNTGIRLVIRPGVSR
mgnify:CR=1 FL=1